LKIKPKKDEEDWNLWFIVTMIGLEIHRTASVRQGSSFTYWEHLSVETQRILFMCMCRMIIKIIFVRTNDSDADILIKNVNKEKYDKHVVKFLGKC
jgi:uncharacterized membrane protein YhdT